MSLQEQNIPENYEELKKYHIQVINEYQQFKSHSRQNIEILKAEVKRLSSIVFAASSEAYKAVALFNEPEMKSDAEDAIAKEQERDQTTEVKPHTRKKGGRKPIPDHFKRVEIVYDIKEEEKTCKNDGTPLHEIGRDVSEELEFIPATLRVIKHITIKYGCRTCEEGVIQAKAPLRPIPRSIASASLLAHVAVSKYLFSLPLYRQEQQFQKMGIELPRNTLSQWMIKVGDLLTPLVKKLKDVTLEGPVIQCDETPVQVLNIEERPSPKQCYMWSVARWGPDKKIVTYHYSVDRSKEFANELLLDYQGFLQADGYRGYSEICSKKGVTRVGCMAHVRRKFIDFLKTLPSSERKTHFVCDFVTMMQELYAIEKDLRENSIPNRSEVRTQKSKPILEKMHAWLITNSCGIAEKSILGRAFSYALGEWQHVIKYVEHDNCEIDNNLIENALRPFCLGKKNWLFCDTERGANASANIYSVIQTAKHNNIDPEFYLKHILSDVSRLETDDGIESLLPWKIGAAAK